jgi:SLAP domain-containing protein
MKGSTLGLLAVAGLAAFYFANLGVAGATVQFQFAGVEFLSVGQLQITILVQNVSNANIALNSMTLELTANGNDIGNAAVFPQTPIIIQSNSQQPVAVVVNLNWLEIPDTIAQLIQGNISSINFKADGNANINNAVLPIHIGTQVAA